MFFSIRVITLFLAVMLTAAASGQSSSRATASATIVTDPDLSISEGVNFKEIILSYADTRKKSIDYKLISSYTISDYSCSISIPSSVTLHQLNGAATISAILSVEPGCDPSQGKTIMIGAKFNTNRQLPPGIYSATTYNITVNYN
jgi:hypothetical protein